MSSGKEVIDAVVAGAGCAGLLFSARLASRGFSVLLLERGSANELGYQRYDLVESGALELAGICCDFINDFPPLELSELGVCGEEKKIVLNDCSFRLIDRKALSAQLYDEAIKAGVEFIPMCIVGGVEVEKGCVVGVRSDRGYFRSRLAVDATGAERALSRSLPLGMGIPRMIMPDDYASVYREFRFIDESGKENTHTEPGVRYYIGGGGRQFMVVRGENGKKFEELGTTVLESTGPCNPEEYLKKMFMETQTGGGQVLLRSGGRIPTRRPLDSMVASGFIALGDAACQALPISGRGVGGALLGAVFAADSASFALEAKCTDVEALWSYNLEFMKERGAVMAALDYLRMFIQNLSERELSRVMSTGLLNSGVARLIVFGGSGAGKSCRLLKLNIKGISEPMLMNSFVRALRQAERIYKHYTSYPREYDVGEFNEWKDESDSLFREIQRV